ncbi:MAG: hypothetical protein DHS20C05_21160 [Hyphococcus sp.]|nr:MAG: hypothetical protein DHS20C05_21160 [Marinicaulis sp.]
MLTFLLSPHGRTSRGGYWAFIGGLFVLTIIAIIADESLGTGGFDTGTGLFEAIVSILAIWPGIAVSVRRFHDRNMTGWWYLILLIAMFVVGIAGAVVGGIISGVDFTAMENMSDTQMISVFWPGILGVMLVAIYWFFIQLVLPGQQGENKYGPDPLAK